MMLETHNDAWYTGNNTLNALNGTRDESCRSDDPVKMGLNEQLFTTIPATVAQTWNLSKILHRRIFRPNILHRQFHLISTLLVRKNTKNE